MTVEPPEGQQVATADAAGKQADRLQQLRQVLTEIVNEGQADPHQRQNQIDHLTGEPLQAFQQDRRGEAQSIAQKEGQQDEQDIEEHR